MKEYLTSVVAVILVSSVLSCITPDGKSKKTLSFAMAVCVLAVIVIPVKGIGLGDGLYSIFDGNINNEQINDGYFDESVKKSIEKGIAVSLSEKFEISNDSIEVFAETDIIGEEIIIKRVTVNLKGSGISADSPSIIRYIEENCGAECEVKINGK